MPEYTPLAQIPIPFGVETDQVPADLKRAFTTFDPMLVLRATTTADRDAKFYNVPTGTIVTGTQTKAVWRKEDTGWSEVWSDSGWTAVPALLSGFTAVDMPAWRRIGMIVSWRGLVQLPSGYDSSQGLLPVCAVPALATPPSANYRPAVVLQGTANVMCSYYAGNWQLYATAYTAAYIGMGFTYAVA